MDARRKLALLVFLSVLLLTLVQRGGAAMPFTLKSSAFASGAEIPKKFTCEDADVSPPLEWSGAPAKTASFALIMDDPDAPNGTWVHWVLWNVPPNAHSLPEALPKREQLDDGGRQGRNSSRNVGYNGPCPPPGKPHRYFFRLYALDGKLDLAPGATRKELDDAMKGHILGETEYMGTFRR
jgi:Raf kinase inhibitor-like YbhB/YbcL family protein